jgi:heme O synthase-like polyprenyltransferase
MASMNLVNQDRAAGDSGGRRKNRQAKFVLCYFVFIVVQFLLIYYYLLAYFYSTSMLLEPSLALLLHRQSCSFLRAHARACISRGRYDDNDDNDNSDTMYIYSSVHFTVFSICCLFKILLKFQPKTRPRNKQLHKFTPMC